MTDQRQAVMAEALRLTRDGRLDEATALLRGGNQGVSSDIRREPPHPAAPGRPSDRSVSTEARRRPMRLQRPPSPDG
jgi:hypothetical protein